jgi:hypothetical protein
MVSIPQDGAKKSILLPGKFSLRGFKTTVDIIISLYDPFGSKVCGIFFPEVWAG